MRPKSRYKTLDLLKRRECWKVVLVVESSTHARVAIPVFVYRYVRPDRIRAVPYRTSYEQVDYNVLYITAIVIL